MRAAGFAGLAFAETPAQVLTAMMLAGAGHLVGGMAYDYGQRHDLQLATWLFFLVVGLVTALALWLNNRRFSQVREEPLARTSATTTTAIAGSTAG